MARLRLAAALAASALALSPVAASAQAKKAPAPVAPNPAQVQRAAAIFNVYMGALQSKEVPQVVKNVLFICVYSNPFSKIADGTDKAIAAKKVDKNNPNNMLGAMSAVCGMRPEMLKQPVTPPKK